MMTTSQALDLADTLLIHVLQDPELLSSLIGRSGIDPAQLGQLVRSEGVREFILEFIAESDDRVIACSDALGVPASDIGMAARLLARRD